MSASIRITYQENADGFFEAQQEAAAVRPPNPPIPRMMPKKMFVFLVAIAFSVATLQQISRGTQLWIIVTALIGCTGLLLFWWWFFKKIGIGKEPDLPPTGQTGITAVQWREAYRKQIGRDETRVVVEFNDTGFRTIADTGKETERTWNSIARVVEREKGVLFFARRRFFGLVRIYHWFPRSAFASDADFEALLQLVTPRIASVTRLTAK